MAIRKPRALKPATIVVAAALVAGCAGSGGVHYAYDPVEGRQYFDVGGIGELSGYPRHNDAGRTFGQLQRYTRRQEAAARNRPD